MTPADDFCGDAAIRSPQFAPSSAFPSSSTPRIAAATIPTASCRWRGSTATRSAARRIASSTSCSAQPCRSARRCSPPISRAPISTSTASRGSSTRACSPSRCRPSPTSARRASPAGSAPCPSWSARGSTSIPAGCRWPKRSAASKSVYKPYHDALKQLVTRTHAPLRLRRAGRLPFDAGQRSASATPASGRTSSSAIASARRRRPALTEQAIGLLIAMGYTVAHNKPYAGGFITEHYGRPGARPACAADRDQPRPLHERADVSEIERLRCAGRRSGALHRRPDGDPRLSFHRACRWPPSRRHASRHSTDLEPA